MLVCPEIPANTGNVARSCAVAGCRLHLVEPLGFSLEDKHLKRAGLDYWSTLDIKTHPGLAAFLETEAPERFFLLSTHGETSIFNTEIRDGDYLFFGRETAGLPSALMEAYPSARRRIPMRPSERSLNLSNAVAIVMYEGLRQLGFPGFH